MSRRKESCHNGSRKGRVGYLEIGADGRENHEGARRNLAACVDSLQFAAGGKVAIPAQDLA